MTTNSIKSILLSAKNIYLSQRSNDNIDFELSILLSHVICRSRSYLFLNPNEQVESDKVNLFNCYVNRLINKEPLDLIIGYSEFYGYEFYNSNCTLVPRNDTERLVSKSVELLIPNIKNLEYISILDLGTGTGCIISSIALELLKVFPNLKLNLYAIDINHEIIDLANKNFNRLGLYVKTYIGNWFSPIKDLNIQFDLIVSNPPYIDINDKHLLDLNYEPKSALVSDNNGYKDIFYIIDKSYRYMKDNGYMIIEHGYQQGTNINKYWQSDSKWHKIGNVIDYGGNWRCTFAQYKAKK